MSALGLALFLVAFYVLPIARPLPYEWVWVHAPQHFPHLVLAAHGKLIFNGAFYLEMALYWQMCLGLAALFEWWARHDDPEWAGLAAGFQRRAALGGFDALLILLFIGLIVACVWNGYPVHGPLSAGLATLSMLTVGPLWSGITRRRRQDLSLPKDARDLRPNEPAEVLLRASEAGPPAPTSPATERALVSTAGAAEADRAPASPPTEPAGPPSAPREVAI